jgi:hypothetical protein
MPERRRAGEIVTGPLTGTPLLLQPGPWLLPGLSILA